jgi:putative ABC transport system substrate-binding protein
MSSRREFITLLGGAAAWPLEARAEQADRVKRVGVLMGRAESDPEASDKLRHFAGGWQHWDGWGAKRRGRVSLARR